MTHSLADHSVENPHLATLPRPGNSGRVQSARWAEDVLPLATILVLTLVNNWVLVSHFYGYVYGFHDLALTTDWFTNALYQSKPFWVTQYALNHLSIHFTPTLLLLIPLYRLSESSYLLLFLGTLAIAVSLYLGHRWWMALSLDPSQSVWLRSTVSAAMILFIGLNLFTKTILDSAHIELFYLPLFLGFVLCLRSGRKTRWAALFFLLALGIREDAGFYLGFQTLALLFMPGQADPRRTRWTLLVFSGCALLYVIAAVGIIPPHFFGVHDAGVDRGWSEWGTGWAEVATNILTSPKRVLQQIAHSSFARLNRSFAFLPWLNPPVAALVNTPGVPLYAASAPDKRYLWFYNGSFLLAGFILAFYAGCFQVLRWSRAVWTRMPALQRGRQPVLGLAMAALVVVSLVNFRATVEAPDGYAPKWNDAALQNAAFIQECLKRCRLPKVAADFRHIVFVPNRVERYLLDRLILADGFFIFDPAQGIPEDATADNQMEHSADGSTFILEAQTNGRRFFVRKGSDCGRLSSRPP